MTNTAKGEPTVVARAERVITQQDYEDTLAAAKRRIAGIKADSRPCIASG